MKAVLSVGGVLAFMLLGPAPSAPDSHWILLRSANFEVHSTAGADAARDALKQFEQLREFFGRAGRRVPSVRAALDLGVLSQ